MKELPVALKRAALFLNQVPVVSPSRVTVLSKAPYRAKKLTVTSSETQIRLGHLERTRPCLPSSAQPAADPLMTGVHSASHTPASIGGYREVYGGSWERDDPPFQRSPSLDSRPRSLSNFFFTLTAPNTITIIHWSLGRASRISLNLYIYGQLVHHPGGCISDLRNGPFFALWSSVVLADKQCLANPRRRIQVVLMNPAFSSSLVGLWSIEPHRQYFVQTSWSILPTQAHRANESSIAEGIFGAIGASILKPNPFLGYNMARTPCNARYHR